MEVWKCLPGAGPPVTNRKDRGKAPGLLIGRDACAMLPAKPIPHVRSFLTDTPNLLYLLFFFPPRRTLAGRGVLTLEENLLLAIPFAPLLLPLPPLSLWALLHHPLILLLLLAVPLSRSLLSVKRQPTSATTPISHHPCFGSQSQVPGSHFLHTVPFAHAAAQRLHPSAFRSRRSLPKPKKVVGLANHSKPQPTPHTGIRTLHTSARAAFLFSPVQFLHLLTASRSTHAAARRRPSHPTFFYLKTSFPLLFFPPPLLLPMNTFRPIVGRIGSSLTGGTTHLHTPMLRRYALGFSGAARPHGTMASTNPVEDAIRSKVTAAFSPTTLEIYNDSHLHSHHKAMAGSTSKETHFRLVITSESFKSKMQSARHRMVYALLREEMAREGGIHALQLKTLTPEEEERQKAKKAAEAQASEDST
ncbi:BolA-like protein [Colletotrichum acutatum]